MADLTADRPAHSRARDKSVEAVRERKREVILLLFGRGFSHGRVKRELAAKYGLSPRQVSRYIQVVEGQFARDNESDPGMSRAQYREMVTAMIDEFRTLGTPAAISAAARLTETLGKMHGHLTERVEVKHEGEIVAGDVRALVVASIQQLRDRARVVDAQVEVPALPAKVKP